MAAQVVWKFWLAEVVLGKNTLPDPIVIVSMPKGAKTLCAINQRDSLVIYAEVDPDATVVQRRFRVAGTGQDLELPVNRKYIGTVKFWDATIILHVYDLDY